MPTKPKPTTAPLPSRQTKTERHNALLASLHAQAPEGAGLSRFGEFQAEPEKIREGSSKFSTAALRTWGKAQGWKIVASESYDFRTGRYHDAKLRMDAWFLVRGKLVLCQAGTPGEEKAHLRDFVGLYGFEFCAEESLTVLWVEFVRGVAEPSRTARWCIEGRRGKGYSEAEVAELCRKR